jgi:hypothetical protein
MTAGDEHADDLEPEVNEGAEIETERYEEGDDDEGIPPGAEATESSDRDHKHRIPADADVEAPEDEASDSI